MVRRRGAQGGDKTQTAAFQSGTRRLWKGDRELLRAMQNFSKTGQVRVVAAGMRKELQEAAKIAKQAVPSQFKEARKGMGSRFKAGKMVPPSFVGLVGNQVGKKESQQQKAGEKLRKKREAAERAGVGISMRNWHWMVLGVKNRRTRDGHNRGMMPGYFPNFMRKAMGGASGRLNAAFLAGAKLGFNKEVRKIAREAAAK